MGAACCIEAPSGSKWSHDPEDFTLDEVEMYKTTVPELDDAFTAASDAVNWVVSANNDIVSSVEAIKVTASVLTGANYVVVGSDYSLSLWKPGDEKDVQLTEAEVAELFRVNEVKKAYETAMAAGQTLKTVLREVPGFEIATGKNDRLIYKHPAKCWNAEEAAVESAKQAVWSYRRTLFKLKKACMQASLKEALDFKKAVVEILVNLKKRAKTLKPKAVIDPSGIAKALAGEAVEPTDVIKLDAGDEVYHALPEKYKMAYDTIFGEEGVVTCVQGIIRELTSVKWEVEAAQSVVDSAVDGLSDPEALKAMCDAAGLTFRHVLKVPGKVASNTKALKETPAIMQKLVDTLTMVVKEVGAAVTAAEYAAGAA